MSQIDVRGAPNDDPEGAADLQPNLRCDEVRMLIITAALQDEYRDR